MARALRQAWWAPLAALLVLGQLLIAVAFLFDADDAEETIVGVAIAVVGAAVLAVGIWKRPTARGLGNTLIVVGALFAAFWFWSLLLPIVALVVIVGLVFTEMRARAAQPSS